MSLNLGFDDDDNDDDNDDFDNDDKNSCISKQQKSDISYNSTSYVIQYKTYFDIDDGNPQDQ